LFNSIASSQVYHVISDTASDTGLNALVRHRINRKLVV
ncbi:MAG: hypothetical protein ACI86C_001735, partial [Candidatus Latescibacterota bacterium]